MMTGATKGIGLALVQQLVVRPDTVVVAGTRTYPLPREHALQLLANQYPDTLHIVKITSADEEDNAAAAEAIRAKLGYVDVLIANAGITSAPNKVIDQPAADLRLDFEINTVGPVILYQQFAPLLAASTAPTPKFVVMSTVAAQIAEAMPLTMNAYGASKAAMNYLSKKVDMEDPRVAAFPIQPGRVHTPGATRVFAQLGMPVPSTHITPEESARGVLAVIDVATKESHGGRFWDENGKELTY